MGSQLSPDQARLYRRVDELLHYRWDPIGVAGIPEARDEYQTYLPQVFKMIVEEIPAEQIKNFLIRVEIEQMGIAQREGRAENLDGLLNSLHVSRELLLDSSP